MTQVWIMPVYDPAKCDDVDYWRLRYEQSQGTYPPELYQPGPNGTAAGSICRRCGEKLRTWHMCPDLRSRP